MKMERHSKIVELIGKYEIETQEELAEYLNKEGYNVTQATVSRDIRELKLSKIQTENGGQKYAVFHPQTAFNDKYTRILHDSFVSMDMAQNILVIKTVSGMAMAVAAALDAIHFSEIVGCIAGDDTVMCAVRTVDDTIVLMDKIRKLIAWDEGRWVHAFFAGTPLIRRNGKRMLYHLRVKNLALIDSAEVEFGDGLNILTGETGAGKSIIIGSVQIALGGKAPKEMIRRGCDSAYIELVFSIDDERKREQLKEHDVYPDEEGILTISKKITPTRSISRINDETVTAARLREITGLLIDLHGQHEHQSLVNASKHLEILDAYGGEKLLPFKQNTEAAYRLYMQLKQKCAAFASDQETRLREMDFCRFEIEEIENAALKDGEEEKVAADFKRFSNARRIAESLSQAYDAVSGDAVSRAFREIDGAMAFDEGLKGIRDELCDVDSLLSDLSREISGYMDDMTFDEAAFQETQERLDLIRSLETKYGKTIPEVLQALEEKKARLQELENYDELREQAEKELEQAEAVLKEHSEALSAAR